MSGDAAEPLVGGMVLSELSEKLPILPTEKFLAAMALLQPVAEHEDVTGVLELARPRLRMLRPERPPRAKRLLCLPFEDLLCTSVHDTGEARIGRSAIEPMWGLLAAQIPKRLAALDRAARNLGSGNYRDYRRVAESIWREAAFVLGTKMPAEHPHLTSFGLAHAALTAAGAIQDFKSAFPKKPIPKLSAEIERAIIETIDRLRDDRRALDGFLLVISARLVNPGALLTFIEAHDLPRPAALVRRIETVAVGQLTDRAVEFADTTTELTPEALAAEAEALFRAVADTKQAIGPKARGALEAGTVTLKAVIREAISEQVIGRVDAVIAPAMSDAPNADEVEAAEAHARALNRARRLAPLVGLGDTAEQASGALRARLDVRIAASLDRPKVEGLEAARETKATLFRTIRMIEMLDGSAAANLILQQVKHHVGKSG